MRLYELYLHIVYDSIWLKSKHIKLKRPQDYLLANYKIGLMDLQNQRLVQNFRNDCEYLRIRQIAKVSKVSRF